MNQLALDFEAPIQETHQQPFVTPRPRPVQAVSTPAPAPVPDKKIEDFGEHIDGARKDSLRKMAQSVANITLEDLIASPLGKVWTKPDFQKMFQDGKLSGEKAVFLESVTRVITSDVKPKRVYRLKPWAMRIHNRISALGTFLESNEDPSREALEKIFDTPEHRLQAEALQQILSAVGFPASKVSRFSVPEFESYFGQDEQGRLRHFVRAKIGGKDNYWKRYDSIEEAIADSLRAVKVGLGYDDITYTEKDFTAIVSDRTFRDIETGHYKVLWMTRSAIKEKVCETMSEAEQELQRLKERGMNPIIKPEKIRQIESTTYQAAVKDPYSGNYVPVDDFKTQDKEEIKAYLRDNLSSLQAAANRTLSDKYSRESKTTLADRLNIWVQYNASRNDYDICLGLSTTTSAGNMLVLHHTPTSREGLKWIEDHRQALAERTRDFRAERRNGTKFAPNRPRVGENYRHGRDIRPEDYDATFDFYGVQFGNYTTQDDRQRAMNEAYDALLDLSKVLGLSPKAITLPVKDETTGEWRNLALAFGARGVGGFAAHYEPDNIIINLTKPSGAGSLAHEWWHALDNYFGKVAGQPIGYITEQNKKPREAFAAVREELRQAYTDLTRAVERSDYAHRSMDSTYWGSTVELTARLFAEYVKKKITAKGEINDFLTHVIPTEEQWMRRNYAFCEEVADNLHITSGRMTFEQFCQRDDALAGYRYPTRDELSRFEPLLDKVFTVMKEKIEEEKAVLYHVEQQPLPSPSKTEKQLAELLVDRMRQMGLKVVTDPEALRKAYREGKGIERMHTPQGEVYGFYKSNTIYLDREKINLQTPIHEFTHLWDAALRFAQPALWERGKQLMKQTKEWGRVLNDPAYAGIRHDEDKVAGEVHARLTARHGEDLIRLAAQKGSTHPLRAVGQWMCQALDWVRQLFYKPGNRHQGWTKETAQKVEVKDFIRMPLYSLLSNPPEHLYLTVQQEVQHTQKQKTEQERKRLPKARLN